MRIKKRAGRRVDLTSNNKSRADVRVSGDLSLAGVSTAPPGGEWSNIVDDIVLEAGRSKREG